MSGAKWPCDKDVRALVEECRRDGWKVERLASGHAMVTAPNGEFVPMSSSPSDQWSVRRYRKRIAKIRRNLGEK